MHIIGITGPSGAGKSMLCGVLQKNNIHTIDADEVYHSLLVPPSPCLDALTEAFGKDILATDGSLDRKALSKLVFGEENKDKLLLLNRITHKYVMAEIKAILCSYEREGAEVCVIDAPLLIEAGVNEICDYVIAVVAEKSIRARRIAERDGIDEEAAHLRINSQKPDSFYEENCDFVLQNNLRLKELGLFVDMSLRDRGIIK